MSLAGSASGGGRQCGLLRCLGWEFGGGLGVGPELVFWHSHEVGEGPAVAGVGPGSGNPAADGLGSTPRRAATSVSVRREAARARRRGSFTTGPPQSGGPTITEDVPRRPSRSPIRGTHVRVLKRGFWHVKPPRVRRTLRGRGPNLKNPGGTCQTLPIPPISTPERWRVPDRTHRFRSPHRRRPTR